MINNFNTDNNPLCTFCWFPSLICRKVLQLSIRGGSTQTNLAREPQSGAGAQRPGRRRHQVLPSWHDLLCWHGTAQETEMFLFLPFMSLNKTPINWHLYDLHPTSPGQWRVQTPDFPGLPGLLQCVCASPGLFFPPAVWNHWSAHRCWLEDEGIRHWCQGSEAVRLLLGL